MVNTTATATCINLATTTRVTSVSSASSKPTKSTRPTSQAQTRLTSITSNTMSKKRTYDGEVKQNQAQTPGLILSYPQEMEVDTIKNENVSIQTRPHDKLKHVVAELHKEIEFINLRQRMDESRKAYVGGGVGGSRRSLDRKKSSSPLGERDVFFDWKEEVLR